MRKYIKSATVVFILVLAATLWISTDVDRYFKFAKSMEIFGEAYKIINQEYVDETDPNQLMRIAIDSMLSSIDPYTNYFSEYQMGKARINYFGFWDGVGFEITEHNGKILVSEVFEESAASASGVFVGDELLTIDGANIKGKNFEDIEQSLHGKAGTQVMVKLKSQNKNEIRELNLTRSKIERKNVPFYTMIDDKTAYIVLTTFTDRAGDNVAEALKELQKKHKVKQLVLDLRENGGGLLIEAVNLCNIFLPKGEEIVYIKNRVADWDRSFPTLNSPVDIKIPLVVLINERSASASEIVAGAIQDLDRGILVGRKSFGKGLVQNTYDIGYNSKVKLTTARYYIPSGRCIQALEYKSGVAAKITDSLQNNFKTRNGRTVNNSGGLIPDVEVKSNDNISILKSLIEDKVIFDFANKYRLEHDSISVPENFKLSESEYQGFIGFLANGNYKYPTEAEKELEKTVQKAKEANNYDLMKIQFESMSNKLKEQKKKDLAKHQKIIKETLEAEIISRYYFEKGKLQYKLTRDKDILEALKILEDQANYNKILNTSSNK